MRQNNRFDHGPRAFDVGKNEPDERPVYLVAIDDTDDLYSQGTGFHARQLGRKLQEQGIGRLLDITRHQLLFDRRIPYTSHNSSLCLRIAMDDFNSDRLIELCRTYLLSESAAASDAGLCIMKWDAVPPEIEEFGRRAKTEILNLDMALAFKDKGLIHFEGLTGDHGGMIGSLAAVGLRHGGQDGRIAWRPGVRETTGIVTAAELLATTGIDLIRHADTGAAIDAEDRIDVRPWPRAVLIDGKAVLLVQKAGSYHDHFNWQLAAKSILQTY